MITPEKIKKLDNLIGNSRKIVIVTHTHPDGDALGSSGAVYHYLRGRGCEDVGMVHETAPATISFIADDIEAVSPADAGSLFESADLIICTDFNGLQRSGEARDAIERSKAPKVLFDHHLNPQVEAFDLVFSRPDASSACEIVYEVLRAMPEIGGDSIRLPERCLYCLMCGMTTDTNNFANSVFPSTFAMASDLIACGVDRDGIVERLFNCYRANRVKAIAWILSNRMTIREDGLATIAVSNNDWHEFGLLDGELEGMVNIPLTIENVKMCIHVREDAKNKDELRVSVRSKRGWSAQQVAVRYFHGGGHEQAAGGKILIPEDLSGIEELPKLIEKIKI